MRLPKPRKAVNPDSITVAETLDLTARWNHAFHPYESAPDSNDGDSTVAVDADQSSELHDGNPF
jgi:hypothetical protein